VHVGRNIVVMYDQPHQPCACKPLDGLMANMGPCIEVELAWGRRVPLDACE
jgi:hypothetical protein